MNLNEEKDNLGINTIFNNKALIKVTHVMVQ